MKNLTRNYEKIVNCYEEKVMIMQKKYDYGGKSHDYETNVILFLLFEEISLINYTKLTIYILVYIVYMYNEIFI